MKKGILAKGFVLVCFALLFFGGRISGSGECVQAATDRKKIEYNEYDSRVIPDKYNTGAKGTLQESGIGQKLGNIQLAAGNNGTANMLDFKYRNTEVSGTVLFENMDFSQYTFAVNHSTEAKNDIRLVFRNCRFSSASVEKGPSPVYCVFENCTFNSFYGGNASFDKCYFGGSYNDGMVPFCNVQVRNCYFADMTDAVASGKEVHTDGTQIYGKAGLDAANISFNNCRFELPALQKSESTAYVNACIMLQMEYSNANGIYFTDCIVNGGGYSIYAWSKTTDFTLKNIGFSNIRFGCASKFGRLYSRISPAVEMEKMWDTSALYVGSVWKENGRTHISVTNDTNLERKLLIYTDQGVFEQSIKACPKASQFTSSMTFEQMPFDIDVVIPTECNFVVCYDITTEGFGEQLRYVNWSGETVYLTEELDTRLFSGNEKVLASGSCGKEAEYVLTNTGILTIKGKGATESYHSGKLPPWADYKEYIQEIRVESGIEALGNQMFRNYTGVRSLSLPEGLKSIGGRIFEGCSGLEEITLPGTLQKVGDVAFSGTIRNVYFNGPDWSVVELGKSNEGWASRVICLVGSTPMPSPTPAIVPSLTPTPVPKESVPTVTPVPTKPVVTPTKSETPSVAPTKAPSPTAIARPTKPVIPSAVPTKAPSPTAIARPTKSVIPSTVPTKAPSPTAIARPTKSVIPSAVPTKAPSPTAMTRPDSAGSLVLSAISTVTPTSKKSGAPTAEPIEQAESDTVLRPTPTVTLAPFAPEGSVSDEAKEQEIIRRENEVILNKLILKQEREATFEKVWISIIGGAIVVFLVFIIVSKRRSRK